jgi:hypothetical protein
LPWRSSWWCWWLPEGLGMSGFDPLSSWNELPGLCFGSIPRTCLLSIVNTCCMDAFCASSMDGFVRTRPCAAHCLGPELSVPCTGTSGGQCTTRVRGSTCPSICRIPYMSCLSPSLPCLYRSMVRSNPNRAARPHPQSLGDGEEDRPRGSRACRPSNAQSSQQ